MKNKKFVVLILMLVLVAVQPVNAEELEHDFDFGLETVRGSGEYEIRAADSSFRELVEYPLDLDVINLIYKNNYSSERFNIGGMEISLTTKIDSEEEDFTQDIYNQPTGLQNKDFNTVLKSRVDSFYTIDLNVNSGWQQISDSYAYTVYVGYRRDDYSIDAYDGLRTDLADNSKTPISGEFRSYQAVYSIPYIGAAVRSDQDKAWRFKTSLYYSPLTDLEDENKDFYQDRISEGSADGNSILAEADFYYDITTSFTLNLKLKYNKSDLEGKLKYDEYLNSAANDYSSENEFYQYDIGIGFNF